MVGKLHREPTRHGEPYPETNDVILNLFQDQGLRFWHLTELIIYETLKPPMKQVQGMVQGDKKGNI